MSFLQQAARSFSKTRWWWLSAALGLATLSAMTSLIHDRSVWQDMQRGDRNRSAREVVSAANVRLALFAAQALAGDPRALPARSAPAAAFRLHVQGDSAAITIPTPGTRGEIAGAREVRTAAAPLMRLLFARGQTLAALDAHDENAMPDVVEVRRAGDSTLLFSQPVPEGQWGTTVRGTGALDELLITVSLDPYYAPTVAAFHLYRLQVRHAGILAALSLIAIVIAYGSTRREMQLARTRSDFIAGVSHDLRMPLAQVMLAAETLAAHENLNVDERTSLLRSIIREARRLASLIDNTLLFARSGAVGFAPRPTRVLARTILDGVAEAMSLAVADAEQRLEIDADDSLTAKADPQLLHQALVNLVDNAIKFGPRGQRIRLGAEASERRVRFIVDDEGPGIPAADRQRVFIPYERLERDRETERAGAGVGLSVVRRVSDVTGGRVWIEQRADGPGARVILEVPGE